MILFLYEWKKLQKRKFFLVSLLILFILNMALLLTPYVKDLPNIQLNSAKQEYTRELSGFIDQKLYHKIEVLKTMLANGEKTAYSGDQQGDKLLLNVIHEEMKEQQEYKDLVEHYATMLEDNIQYFKRIDHTVEVAENELLYQTYVNRNLSVFGDHIGWDKLIGYQKSTVLLIILIMIAITPLWSSEREEDMVVMLLSTKRGKRKVYQAKLFFVISFVATMVVLFSLSELVLMKLLYGLEGSSLPIYINEQYRFSTMNVTNIGFWLYCWIFKFFGFQFLSIVVLMISKRVSNSLVSFITSLSSCAIFIAIAELGGFTWNPISTLYLYETVNHRDIHCVLSHAMYNYTIGCISCVVCSILIICYYVRTTRRHKI